MGGRGPGLPNPPPGAAARVSRVYAPLPGTKHRTPPHAAQHAIGPPVGLSRPASTCSGRDRHPGIRRSRADCLVADEDLDPFAGMAPNFDIAAVGLGAAGKAGAWPAQFPEPWRQGRVGARRWGGVRRGRDQQQRQHRESRPPHPATVAARRLHFQPARRCVGNAKAPPRRRIAGHLRIVASVRDQHPGAASGSTPTRTCIAIRWHCGGHAIATFSCIPIPSVAKWARACAPTGLACDYGRQPVV